MIRQPNRILKRVWISKWSGRWRDVSDYATSGFGIRSGQWPYEAEDNHAGIDKFGRSAFVWLRTFATRSE
jgi:hypothetical protein